MLDLIARTGVSERRSAKHFAPLSIAAGLVFALTATPVMAQKGLTPTLPPFPADPFQEAFDLCFDAGIDIDVATDTMEAAGWTIDDFFETGPFIVSMSASRQVDGADIYFFVTFESYATEGLAYCTYAIEGAEAPIDFDAVGPNFGLDGQVANTEGGVFAAWQNVTDEAGMFISARQEGDYFFVQINLLAELEGSGNAGGK